MLAYDHFRFGRRLGLLIPVVIKLAVRLIAPFSPTWPFLAAFEFLIGFFYSIPFTVAFILGECFCLSILEHNSVHRIATTFIGILRFLQETIYAEEYQ